MDRRPDTRDHVLKMRVRRGQQRKDLDLHTRRLVGEDFVDNESLRKARIPLNDVPYPLSNFDGSHQAKVGEPRWSLVLRRLPASASRWLAACSAPSKLRTARVRARSFSRETVSALSVASRKAATFSLSADR